MLRRILIVDDIKSNRLILKEILREHYTVLEAGDGAEALAILRREYETVAAVLLDISMPGMNGFEVLAHIREDMLFSQMPVIMITGNDEEQSRVMALAAGANDYVTKPYRPDIIRHCLKNHIAFHEADERVSTLQRDRLTRLYTRETFFEKVRELVPEKPAGHYAMICFDIDKFKVINDQYGTAMGDTVLQNAAHFFRDGFLPIGGVCCRIAADDFAVLLPREVLDSDELQSIVARSSHVAGLAMPVTYSIGIYIITEPGMPPSSMYDRAMLAASSVKDRFDDKCAYYDEAMRSRLLREQELVTEMIPALVGRQFEAFYQPQYNYSTGALIGAEALVRWRHPTKGLMPPSEYIPVFERNGFIYELDKYIWEEVCASLERWTDEGRNPLPVSVNLSRLDLLHSDLVPTLSNIVKKHRLTPDMLRIEVTESVFAHDSARMISVVKELIRLGFVVEIDDFGSGYSSLNTLKDVPAQVLKLDMKFLESTDDSQRGGNIVESIVRMAKWLGMSVISEGVETSDQADYLLSVGCNYMQGYLFARPMPMADYEILCAEAGKEEHLLKLETVDNLDNNAFWTPESMDTLMFNSYVGAACIFEYINGKIELIRATERYAETVAGNSMTVSDALKFNWSAYLDDESRALIDQMVKSSAKTKKEVGGEFVFVGLPGCPKYTYIRANFRVIATEGVRYLVYNLVENITAQREAERKERDAAKQLQAIIDDTPGGYARMRLSHDGRLTTEYVNEALCRMRGMSAEEILYADRESALVAIHPDDMQPALNVLREVLKTGEKRRTIYRLVCSDGSYIPLNVYGSVSTGEAGEKYVNIFYTELTAEEKANYDMRETLPHILSAIMQSSPDLVFAKDRNLNYICCSPGFVRFAQQSCEADIIGKNDYELWAKDVADHFRADDEKLFSSGESLVNHTEEIPSDDGMRHYSVTSKYIIRDSAGEIIGLYGIGKDITDTRSALDSLRLLTDSIPGGIGRFSVSPEGIRSLYFNDGMCSMLGCTHGEYEEFSSSNLLQYIHPDDLKRLTDAVESVCKSETPLDCYYRHRLIHDSSYIWVNVKGTVTERNGDKTYISAVFYDVTSQREAEERIKSTSEQLQTMMNDIPGGFVRMRVDADGRCVPIYINDGLSQLTGMSHDELMTLYGNDAFAGVHPDDLGLVNDVVQRMLEHGEARSARYRLCRGGGGYVWLSIFGRATTDGKGNTFLSIYYSDASEEEKADETRRSLLDNLPGGAGIYELAPDGLKLVYQNQSYWDLVGLHEETYPDSSAMSAIYPDDIPVIMNELSAAIQEGRGISCDIRLRHVTKGYRPVRLAGRLVPQENGTFRIYATFTPNDPDTATFQKSLPLLLSAIMEASNDYAFAKDKNLRYICCSPAFLRLAGYEHVSDVVGKTDLDLFPTEMAQQFIDNDKALLDSGKPMVDFDESFVSSDNAQHYCLASKYILRAADGEMLGIYGISRDITTEHSESERLRLVNNNIPGGIATYSYRDGQLRTVYCNDGFCRLFGGTREGFNALGSFDPFTWVFNEDKAELIRQIEALVQDDIGVDCVYRAYVKGGGYIWVNLKAVATERHGGTVLFNALLLDVTERQNNIERLRISEEENAIATRLSGNIISRFSLTDRTLSIEPDVARALSLPEVIYDAPEGPIARGAVAPDSANAYIAFFNEITSGKNHATAIFQQRHSGEWRWLEAKSETIFNNAGEALKVIISFGDVTEKVEREAAFRKWQQSLHGKDETAFTLYRCNISKNSALDPPEGNLLDFDFIGGVVNFDERMAEYAEQRISADDRERFKALMNIGTLLSDFYQGNRVLTTEYRELLTDGSTRWLKLTVDLVDSSYSSDIDAYMFFENINEAKQEELKMLRLSETDPLTGILNRSAFSSKVNHLLHHARPETMHALLMLDIDYFKQVNDVFGHITGDRTLVDIAAGLRSIIRRDDLIARLGGDEFVVFMPGIPSARVAQSKAKQICDLVRRSYGNELRISASVGISMAPADGNDFDTLYKKADAALYYVKDSGKNNHAFYTSEMSGRISHIDPDFILPTDDGVNKSDAAANDKTTVSDVIAGGSAADGAAVNATDITAGNAGVNEIDDGSVSGRKRRMLVVEDNSVDSAMLRNLFRDEFITECAHDGASALARLNRYGSEISVVLLDLKMPAPDGFAVLHKMQESPVLSLIPVIVVSGDDRRQTWLESIRQGADDFISKPVDSEHLRIRVRAAVNRAENDRLRASDNLHAALELEFDRFDAMLDHMGIVFIKLDPNDDSFVCHPPMTPYTRQSNPGIGLWQTLLENGVADEETVGHLRALVNSAGEPDTTDGNDMSKSITVRLKVPDGEPRLFRASVYEPYNTPRKDKNIVIVIYDIDVAKK